MAVSRKSTLSGLSEAKKVLQQLPDRVQNRVLQNAVNAGARVMQKAVKAAAPVSEEQSPASKKYGHLINNIRVQALKRVAKAARGARVWTKDAFWAVFYEFGTSHQPARPFFRPAVDTSADDAFVAMRDNLGKGIEREATKLAGSFSQASKSLK